jgi:hypothetical protein
MTIAVLQARFTQGDNQSSAGPISIMPLFEGVTPFEKMLRRHY